MRHARARRLLRDASGVNRSRFRVLWLGAQEDVFQPQPDVAPVPNLVVFHGTFVPLQGLPTIVHAAKLLEPNGIRFRIIGDGQERRVVEASRGELGAANVEFPGRVPLQDMPREIAAASLCLGIFGTSAKAGRVVPNKVFECLAVGRPIVTADTPAIRDALAGQVATVPAGDPEALAREIRALLARPGAARLARGGRARALRGVTTARKRSASCSRATSRSLPVVARRRQATGRAAARRAEAAADRACRAQTSGRSSRRRAA